jgi:parallel beta-helix repeat protein
MQIKIPTMIILFLLLIPIQGIVADSPIELSERVIHAPISINGDVALLQFVTDEGLTGNGSEDNPIILRNYHISTTNVGERMIEIISTSLHLVIQDNDLVAGEPSQWGINIWNSANVDFINNTVSFFSYGVYNDHASNLTLSGNDIVGCVYSVINYYSDFVEIMDNVITEGRFMHHYSNNAIFIGNDFQNAVMSFDTSANITIHSNSFQDSKDTVVQVALLIIVSSSNLDITDNYFYNNTLTIYAISSQYMDISENEFIENKNGIYFVASSMSYVKRNQFIRNGMDLNFDSGSSGNIIYKNNLINATSPSFNDNLANVFSSQEIGNYHSDYIGLSNHTEYDQNNDGIGDVPYDNGIVDNYPLMYPVDFSAPELYVDPLTYNITEGDEIDVTWDVIEDNPSSYTIHVNEVLEVDEALDTDTVIYSLSDLAIGHYVITATVYDEENQEGSSTVIVDVYEALPQSNDTSTSSDGFFDQIGDTLDEYSDQPLVMMGAGSLITIVLFSLVSLLKNRKPKKKKK